jgi:hypothetical protein
MAYDHALADRIRLLLYDMVEAEEKPMMGGLSFIVNHKMCIGILKDELMCRINPAEQESLLSIHGTHHGLYWQTAKRLYIGRTPRHFERKGAQILDSKMLRF